MDRMEKITAELRMMLLKELPETRRKLASEYKQSDIDSLTETIHKLNGAASYCNVPPLKEAAHRLEIALKENSTENLDSLITQLDREIEELLGLETCP